MVLGYGSCSPARGQAGTAVRSLTWCQHIDLLKIRKVKDEVLVHSTIQLYPWLCYRQHRLGAKCYPLAATSVTLSGFCSGSEIPILLRPFGLDGHRTSQVSLVGPCAPFLLLTQLLQGIAVNCFIFLFHCLR